MGHKPSSGAHPEVSLFFTLDFTNCALISRYHRVDLIRYKVTTLALVPSLVHQLVNHPKINQTDLSSLNNLGGGAAYLSWELRQKMLKYAKKVPYWAEGLFPFRLT